MILFIIYLLGLALSLCTAMSVLEQRAKAGRATSAADAEFSIVASLCWPIVAPLMLAVWGVRSSKRKAQLKETRKETSELRKSWK